MLSGNNFYIHFLFLTQLLELPLNLHVDTDEEVRRNEVMENESKNKN